MNRKKLLMRVLPYIVAVVVFWAVSALYFAPQFSDRTLSMNDVQQYGGMGRDIWQHREATGEDPQWTGGMFGGMPAYLITVQYPAMIIRNAAGWFMNLMGEPTALMFLAMTGFWLMLLMCGVNPWVAIPAALAYGLSTYNILIIEAGHITKMRAMGWAPMLVGAVFWTFRRNVWVGGALAALFGTLTIAASHHQITYYFLLVVFAFWLNEFIFTVRDKGWGADIIKPGEGLRRRAPGQIGKFSPLGSVKLFSIRKGWGRFWLTTGVLGFAAALAAGANFTHIWYTFEHSPETIRGGSEVAEAKSVDAGGLDLEYATAWSYGVGESVNMFIPNFRGGASAGGFAPDGQVATVLRRSGINPSIATQLPGYWGTQPFTGGPTYLGAVVVFLFVLGMFTLPARQKWWVLAVSVFGLLLAWGRNAMWFTELSFAALPGYNKFRTVAMALAILQWSVPFVAALVMSGLWKRDFEKTQFTKGLWWALGLTGGVALFFALFGGGIYDFSGAGDDYYSNIPGLVEAMRSERLALFRADCWRSLMFVLLTAGVVWMWTRVKETKRWWGIVALGALVLCDLMGVNLRYLSWDDFHIRSQVEVSPDGADLAIMEDTEPGFRVFNTSNPFNEAYTSHFHRSVGGYHGAKLARYQDVIDRYLSRFDLGVLNMLNAKYFIVEPTQTGETEGAAARQAQLNPDANGAAWFVEEVVWVDGAREELEALGGIDNKREAVVDKRFAEVAEVAPIESAGLADSLPDAASSSSIELVEYRPNYLRYEALSARERVAVFSEIYYNKGWKAYIDGKEAPYFRADYILRAMVVPAGAHTIEWRFRAPRFAAVEGITLGCSIVILLWLAAAVVLEERKKSKKYGSGR